MFPNGDGKLGLQHFLGQDSNQNDGNYVEGPMLSIGSLNTWMVAVVRYLVRKEKCGGHCQEQYVSTYGTLVQAAKKQLIGSFRESLKFSSWKVITVEKHGRLDAKRERR